MTQFSFVVTHIHRYICLARIAHKTKKDELSSRTSVLYAFTKWLAIINGFVLKQSEL